VACGFTPGELADYGRGATQCFALLSTGDKEAQRTRLRANHMTLVLVCIMVPAVDGEGSSALRSSNMIAIELGKLKVS